MHVCRLKIWSVGLKFMVDGNSKFHVGLIVEPMDNTTSLLMYSKPMMRPQVVSVVIDIGNEEKKVNLNVCLLYTNVAVYPTGLFPFQ